MKEILLDGIAQLKDFDIENPSQVTEDGFIFLSKCKRWVLEIWPNEEDSRVCISVHKVEEAPNYTHKTTLPKKDVASAVLYRIRGVHK